jgi:hypothetical protein
MVSPDSRAYRARRQAETPLSVLCRFPEPALFYRLSFTQSFGQFRKKLNPNLEDACASRVNIGNHARGRPVGLAVDRSGGLLIADDVGDTVWRVSSSNRQSALNN